jgi:hypothetical protein
VSGDVTEANTEIEHLRARVAALEEELIEVKAWANREAAEAQARTYWLDRWHLDLNAVMERRSAERARALARAMRSVIRLLRRLK